MLQYTYGVTSPVQSMTTRYDAYKQILLREHVHTYTEVYNTDEIALKLAFSTNNIPSNILILLSGAVLIVIVW